MSKNKKEKNIKDNDNNGFYEKMKNDKKYNAKVQFIGYGVFILLIVVFLNISSMNSGINSGVENTVNDFLDEDNIIDDNSNEEDNSELSLLDKLNDNYEYDIKLEVTKNSEIIKQRYYGKSFGNNVLINKEVNGVNSTYYNVSNYYYADSDSGEYDLVQGSVIYDLIEGKYIEALDVLRLIKKASLEHVITSSSGAKEEVYNLLVRDIVISNKSDDIITINLIEDEDKLSIDIDYTNLLKVFDKTIEKCNISYEYTKIEMVEKFSVMDDNNKE